MPIRTKKSAVRPKPKPTTKPTRVPSRKKVKASPSGSLPVQTSGDTTAAGLEDFGVTFEQSEESIAELFAETEEAEDQMTNEGAQPKRSRGKSVAIGLAVIAAGLSIAGAAWTQRDRVDFDSISDNFSSSEEEPTEQIVADVTRFTVSGSDVGTADTRGTEVLIEAGKNILIYMDYNEQVKGAEFTIRVLDETDTQRLNTAEYKLGSDTFHAAINNIFDPGKYTLQLTREDGSLLAENDFRIE